MLNRVSLMAGLSGLVAGLLGACGGEVVVESPAPPMITATAASAPTPSVIAVPKAPAAPSVATSAPTAPSASAPAPIPDALPQPAWLDRVRLPAADPCRAMLAPFALGLALGASKSSAAPKVEVSLSGSTYLRFYVIEVGGQAPATYRLELLDDSVLMCRFNRLSLDPTAKLGNDLRAAATIEELTVARAQVTPASDPCREVVALLAASSAIFEVCPPLLALDVTLREPGPARNYDVNVQGQAFEVDGRRIDNRSAGRLELGKGDLRCFVNAVR
jgi:hypothetical protein